MTEERRISGQILVLSDMGDESYYAEADGTETIYAFRLTKLGLTGYGKSAESAEANVRKMLDAFLDDLEEKGIFESVMNKAGVTWHFEDVMRSWVRAPSSHPAVHRKAALAGV